jgi:hypothetical protein
VYYSVLKKNEGRKEEEGRKRRRKTKKELLEGGEGCTALQCTLKYITIQYKWEAVRGLLNCNDSYYYINRTTRVLIIIIAQK